jgi:HSP20 family protein
MNGRGNRGSRENERGGMVRRSGSDFAHRPETAWSGMTGWGGWDPMREVEEMYRRMNSMFGRAFGIDMPASMMRWGQQMQELGAEPDVDVYESDTEFVIHAALPGIDPKDIHLEATEDSIQLTADSRSPFEDQQGGAGGGGGNGGAASGGAEGQKMKQHRQSRYSSHQHFEFSYSFPEAVKAEEAKAEFKNGRLELHLPKRETPETRSRGIRIPINGGQQQPALSASGQGSPSANRAPGGGSAAGAGEATNMTNNSSPMSSATPATETPGDGQASPAKRGMQNEGSGAKNARSREKKAA